MSKNNSSNELSNAACKAFKNHVGEFFINCAALMKITFDGRSLGIIFHILLTGQFPFSTSEDAIFKVPQWPPSVSLVFKQRFICLFALAALFS